MTRETQLQRTARALPTPEKDFEVSVSVKNNHLRARREKLGLTQQELARAAGVNTHGYGQLECISRPPSRVAFICRVPTCNNKINRRRQYPICATCREVYGADQAGWPIEQWPEKKSWAPVAVRLAKFFGCPPEELFPASVEAVKNRRVSVQANAEDVQDTIEALQLSAIPHSERLALPAVEQKLFDDDLRKHVDIVLRTLPPREEKLIRKRYGFDGPERTLTEVGKEFKVSRSRVAQLERRALRMLRRPERAKRVAVYHEQGIDIPESCPICGNRAGYKCASGRYFCAEHIQPANLCNCPPCTDAREHAAAWEEELQRRDEMFERIDDVPPAGTTVLTCVHGNRLTFFKFRAGPQALAGHEILYAGLCAMCVRIPNAFGNMHVRKLKAS